MAYGKEQVNNGIARAGRIIHLLIVGKFYEEKQVLAFSVRYLLTRSMYLSMAET